MVGEASPSLRFRRRLPPIPCRNPRHDVASPHGRAAPSRLRPVLIETSPTRRGCVKVPRTRRAFQQQDSGVVPYGARRKLAAVRGARQRLVPRSRRASRRLRVSLRLKPRTVAARGRGAGCAFAGLLPRWGGTDEELPADVRRVWSPYGCPRNDEVLLSRVAGSAILKINGTKICLLIPGVDYSCLQKKKKKTESL